MNSTRNLMVQKGSERGQQQDKEIERRDYKNITLFIKYKFKYTSHDNTVPQICTIQRRRNFSIYASNLIKINHRLITIYENQTILNNIWYRYQRGTTNIHAILK
jgi:hypothetical protein